MSVVESLDTREIWSLPVMSQEFREGPRVESARDRVRLAYDYETETGEYKWAELEFTGVAALTFTTHEACTEQQVAAYDVLVEVVCSPWMKALQAHRGRPVERLRHYRIYFDEIGCYEVVAGEFRVPAPQAS